MTNAATQDLSEIPFMDTTKINVDFLKLDRATPRLAGKSTCVSDECIIAQLYRGEELGELLQSIAANGYMDIEPLIVLLDDVDQKFIVLEGNRRLAAIRLFRESTLVDAIVRKERHTISIPEITATALETLSEVSIYRVLERYAARSFIGFKHINGVKCPGFSGEQKVKQMGPKLKGENQWQRDGTTRGIQTNSARAEFVWSKKIALIIRATAQPTARSRRSSVVPMHASPMVPASGARRRRPARPKQRRQGPDQGVGAREQGTAHGQRDPEEGVGLFCPGGARPPVPQMIAFIEEHREVYGVEPICRVLPIAPSTYHAHAAVARNPGKASDRSRRDAETVETIKRVHDQSRGRCGVRKVWRQLRREKSAVARCTVERLMRDQGLQGVSRGRKKTTVPDPARPCPEDKVKRTFKADAPDKLWVADFTYAQTAMAMVYAAFIVDVFARKIVGWRVSTSMTTNFVLDALNQAICSRRPAPSGLIHHSDRGMQYLSFRYTERLAEAGIDPSVGSVGDSYDNALAETVIGLFKTEVVKHLGPWKTIGQLEWETMKWVH